MIYHLLVILFLHFVADFLLQTRKMGLNKGKSNMWLGIHVGVYLIAFLIVGMTLGHYITDMNDGGAILILEYVLLNAAIHFGTDWLTSRASGYCYLKMTEHKNQKEYYEQELADREGEEDLTIEQVQKDINYELKKEHMWQYHFWSVIGFDQFLHATALISTYFYFFT